MFRKGDNVAVLSSWNNKGAVRIRRAVVHSAGSKVMRLQYANGEMFKCAFQPEHNVMGAFNGLRIVADADDATLEAEALADGARVNALNVAEGNRRLALGDAFNTRVGQRYIDEQEAPSFRWN